MSLNVSKTLIADSVQKRRSIDELLAFVEGEFNLAETFIDSSIKILKTGKEIQKLSTIRNFADLLKSEDTFDDAKNRLLPAIQELLCQTTSSLDIHCEASILYKTIIKNYSSKHNELVEKILEYILQNINIQKENVTSAAWLEALVEIVDLVSLQSTLELILPLAISQAESTKRVQRRVIATRLIEKLCTILSFEYIRRDLIPCIQMLSQDPSATVRISVAQRFLLFVQSLNNQNEAVSLLLPSLIELTKDDDLGVREAALNILNNCLPYFTIESCKNIIMPLIKKTVDHAIILRDDLLSVLTRQLGSWLISLNNIISDKDKQWFLDTYCRICHLSWKEKNEKKDLSSNIFSSSMSILYLMCRRMCAYNFPCFVATFVEEASKERLLSILNLFCKDSDEEVRVTIAAGFHEIIKLEAHNENGALLNSFVELLCNGTAEVVQHLTQNLNFILQPLYNEIKIINKPNQNSKKVLLKKRETFDDNNFKTENVKPSPIITQLQFDRILISCNHLIRGTGSWRSHEAYLNNLIVLKDLISINDLIITFVPMFQSEILTARALPCRIASAQTLLLMMRKFPCYKQRLSILNFFKQVVAKHHSCQRRRIFLDIIPCILKNFSFEFFVKEFLDEILNMANDKVSNIRLQLCKTFCIIKSYLLFPNNNNEFSEIENCINNLVKIETCLNTKNLIQQYALKFLQIETNHKDCLQNKEKLEEEKKLWTEKIEDKEKFYNENDNKLVLHEETKQKNELKRSATTNIIELPALSEQATNLIKTIKSSASNLNSKTVNQTLNQTTNTNNSKEKNLKSMSLPLNWKTFRVDRLNLAVVRPQPQVTVTQRSPSPMPKNNKDLDKDERKSKLPLATARYRPINATSQLPLKNLPTQNTNVLKTSNAMLKKYCPKNTENLNNRFDSSLFNDFQYSLTNSSSLSSIFNIRRPYNLIKVQSTSDIKKKPSQMSIRVTSMS